MNDQQTDLSKIDDIKELQQLGFDQYQRRETAIQERTIAEANIQAINSRIAQLKNTTDETSSTEE